MKKWYQTSEAWMGMITQIIGVITIIGGITADQGTELSAAAQQLVGAIMTIAATLGYTKARTDVKAARAEAIGSAGYNASDPVKQEQNQAVAIDALKKAGV